MANAIKHISVERGYDVTEYTLCCFGGAGGQHACLVADALGMTRVFIHPLAGVLSAYGMGLADVRALRQQSGRGAAFGGDARRRASRCSTSSRASRAPKSRRRASRADRDRASSARCISSTTAPIRRWKSASAPIGDRPSAPMRRRPDVAALVADFERRYRTQYGFLMPGKALVIEAVAVEAIGATANADEAAPSFAPRAGALRAAKTNRVYTGGAWHARAGVRARRPAARRRASPVRR